MISPVVTSRLARGFSLVEAAVVMGLIGVLAIVVLPRLSVQQGVAEDAASQSTIEAALDAEQTVRSSTGSFANPADPAGNSALTDVNPDVTFVPGSTASNGTDVVSVALSVDASTGREVVGLAVRGGDGTCWLTRRDFAALAGAPTILRAYRPNALPGTCTGDSALLVVPDSTKPSYGRSWQKPIRLS